MEKNAYGTDNNFVPYDPPPSYDSCTSSSSGSGLTFIDFLPVCEGQKGILKTPIYGNFKQVVSRANDWLRGNPHWEVKTCESLTVEVSGASIRSNVTMRWEPSESMITFVRGLRMWIFQNRDRKGYSQIEYLDVMPQELSSLAFGQPEYESLDQVIAKTNNLIRNRRITGRIISVETLKVEMSGSFLDTETCYWIELRNLILHFAFALRTFYLPSEGYAEEIEIVDFVPSLLQSWGMLSPPQFQSFSTVVANAAGWCTQKSGFRIINLQSVMISISRGKAIDAKKMTYLESSDFANDYVRVVRVAHAKNHSSDYGGIQLACRTFIPVQLSSGLRPTYESVQQTKERINAWMRATGARVVNVETREVGMYSTYRPDGPDSTYTFTQPKKSQNWQMIFRVYMDGRPMEPPPHLLPPMPVIVQQKCLLT